MSFVARQGRFDLRVPVIFGVREEQVTGETRDIGLGGLFVATREAPAVGQRISLHLGLPDWDESHIVNGEVRWVREADDGPHPVRDPGMGVKFVKLSLYVAAALHNLVRWHAR